MGPGDWVRAPRRGLWACVPPRVVRPFGRKGRRSVLVLPHVGPRRVRGACVRVGPEAHVRVPGSADGPVLGQRACAHLGSEGRGSVFVFQACALPGWVCGSRAGAAPRAVSVVCPGWACPCACLRF